MSHKIFDRKYPQAVLWFCHFVASTHVPIFAVPPSSSPWLWSSVYLERNKMIFETCSMWIYVRMFEIWNIPWSEGDMELFLGRCHEEKYRGYLKIRFHVTIFPSRSRFSRVWTTRFDAVKRWTNRGQIQFERRTNEDYIRDYQTRILKTFEKF